MFWLSFFPSPTRHYTVSLLSLIRAVLLTETLDSWRQSLSLTCPRWNAPRRELIYFRRLSGRTGRQRDRRRDTVPQRAGASWELSDEIERASGKPSTSDPPPTPPPHLAVKMWLFAFAEICLRLIFWDLRRHLNAFRTEEINDDCVFI